MRGFWQGVALGSIAVAALAMYLGAPQRHPWESRGWKRRRQGVWRSASGRLGAIGKAARAMRP